MKIWSAGRHLWMRTIGSTIAGDGVDSLIFYPAAFLGAVGFTPGLVVTLIVTQWLLKVGWEVVLTPVTYLVVGRSEEHTSELQSLMRISYAVFCLKKKNNI